MELSAQYNSGDTEEKQYDFWEKSGFFHAKPNPKKKPYSIVIPPPNITGILHMGHALNNTIQDIYVRFNRMRGMETLWMPGTDHAGIATQNVVEKKLAKENKTKEHLGRETFLNEVWKWREEYGSTIIKQLKKLGCSCDWQRTRFTMDEGLSKAVLEAFVTLYEKGLIYRGNYIINWCPRCRTALSDEEAEHRDIDGMLYYIKYPVISGDGKEEYVVVATTRPETMLGDVAVCVNPNDKRYKGLKDKKVKLPILDRELKIITDKKVDAKFGTGVLKVTPAHDPVDFELGLAHGLEPINVMNDDATINETGADLAGMDRFEAREAIVDILKDKGLFVKSEAHKHAVGHCYRCHTVVEPRLSRQWFVKMKPLVGPAIEAVKKGKIKFYPKRWTKVYLNWMENMRDWCISRQIWWGHRIPVYYCKECMNRGSSPGTRDSKDYNEFRVPSSEPRGVIVSKIKPEKCPTCGSADIEQDPDVLDTWFSSWLWPFSTMGWPDKTEELKYFYPTNVLVTAQEIIFFWVARMIMAGFEFMKDIPFRDVYIHGTVRDDTGTKMSKSLGNTIDPLDIIESFGADALRYSIISITSQGQDVFLSPKKFEIGRNFANKIWNASRFVLSNLKEAGLERPDSLNLADKWILGRFESARNEVTISLDSYRINEAASRIYEFLWHEYCDWYIEFAKLAIDEKNTRYTLRAVLEGSLRLLHPFMPFITEEIWQKLPGSKGADSIMVSDWPASGKKLISRDAHEKISIIINVIQAVRNLRATWRIEPKLTVNAVIKTGDKNTGDILTEGAIYLKRLARISSFELGEKVVKPPHSAFAVIETIEIFLPLEGVIDIEKEKIRLSGKIENLKNERRSIEGKLKNKAFTEKAPEEVVAKTAERKEFINAEIGSLEKNLKSL